MAMFANKETDEAKGLLVAVKLAKEVGELASNHKKDIPVMIQLVKVARLNRQTEELLIKELAIHYVFQELLNKGGFKKTDIDAMRELNIEPSTLSSGLSLTKKSIEDLVSQNPDSRQAILVLAQRLNLHIVVEMISGEKTSRQQNLLVS